MDIKNKHRDEIINRLENISSNFYHDMDILLFLELLCKQFKPLVYEYDEDERKNRVYEHSIRVFENVKYIIKFIDLQGIIIKPDLLADVTIATLLHDIGKLYKDSKKHNEYSYIMVEYLLDLDKEISEERKTRIKNAVLHHSNKKHDIENMDFCTKILRDADTLDEEAGNGLYELLMVNITNNSKRDNLNKIDYSTADKILFDKTDYHHKEKVRNKLNLIYSKELYEYLLYDASARYFEIRYKDINNSDIIQNLLNFRGLKSFDDGILKIFIQ